MVMTLACAVAAQTARECVGAESGELATAYAAHVQPLIQLYCFDCHSGDSVEADVDLAAYATLDAIRADSRTWLKVREMLDSGQMPPPEAAQPTDEQREVLRGWVAAFLTQEATARAGDPGPVVLRRLNNAQYTYTLLDLTGVETLDPAREFPGDNAAGEGFTNAGAAMVMSPALVTKYLDAAKQVADHAVLLPHGFRFSTSTSRRDWTEETLAQIRGFYQRYTGSGGGSAVNLQGIQFETNRGGLLPVELYLAATLEHRAELQAGSTTCEAVAAEHGLNARYLTSLWQALNSANAHAGSDTDTDTDTDIETNLSPILDQLRSHWRAAQPGDAGALAAEVAQWQQSLWKFNSIGHIGRHLGGTQGPERWMEAVTPLTARHEVKQKIAADAGSTDVVIYLVAGDAGDGSEHDQLVWRNPRFIRPGAEELRLCDVRGADLDSRLGLPPDSFGGERAGSDILPHDLVMSAPTIVAVRLPVEMVAGSEFVAEVELLPNGDGEGSVQARVLMDEPTSNDLVPHVPALVQDQSQARRRMELACEEMRLLFPAALCYSQIVPVDEVITLNLFYREDDHLQRLMLGDQEVAELDRLWDELLYVSQEPLLLAAAYDQLVEYATQDRPDKVIEFAPMKEPIANRAAQFEQRLVESEPSHLEDLWRFAARAYRRPLTESELHGLQKLYGSLRDQQIGHEDAFRLTLARVLVAPPFLYRLETPPEGSEQRPVSGYELASRLSYFLWSSAPDDELLEAAADGTLLEPEVRWSQTQRMLQDDRARRLAREFAAQWLHIYEFDRHDEKSERHFPEFARLRGDMYEESLRFFSDLFQQDRSLLNLLTADYTYVNNNLAEFYGLPSSETDHWRRVDTGDSQRGGVLTQAAVLAKQSGASRTSPILRGNWLSEAVLGEKLPRPPKDVPVLPDTVPGGLTERQLIELHSRDAACAKCHVRIDPMGFALEEFDAIGRRRDRDATGQTIDARTTLADGTPIDGVDGLRRYLVEHRRGDFIRQFNRKLLGFALGRSVQLSDEPLLAIMEQELARNDYRFTAALKPLVLSRQFGEIRGRDADESD